MNIGGQNQRLDTLTNKGANELSQHSNQKTLKMESAQGKLDALSSFEATENAGTFSDAIKSVRLASAELNVDVSREKAGELAAEGFYKAVDLLQRNDNLKSSKTHEELNKLMHAAIDSGAKIEGASLLGGAQPPSSTTIGPNTRLTSASWVPESCIESAEMIVQSAHGNVTWSGPGTSTSPYPVYLEFGNSYVDITNTENVHELGGLSTATNYNFGNSLPSKGEGIGLLNQGADASGYNMHFGAVVKEYQGAVKISDMNEPQGHVGLAKLETTMVYNADDFRGHDYPASGFAMGKLSAFAPSNKSEITS